MYEATLVLDRPRVDVDRALAAQWASLSGDALIISRLRADRYSMPAPQWACPDHVTRQAMYVLMGDADGPCDDVLHVLRQNRCTRVKLVGDVLDTRMRSTAMLLDMHDLSVEVSAEMCVAATADMTEAQHAALHHLALIVSVA